MTFTTREPLPGIGDVTLTWEWEGNRIDPLRFVSCSNPAIQSAVTGHGVDWNAVHARALLKANLLLSLAEREQQWRAENKGDRE